MAQATIETSIQIQATPEQVWQILTDFAAYPEWNPFIRRLEGEMQVGRQIHVAIQDMKFKPTLLAFQANREIRWLGKLLFSGLFDGEHHFLIEDNGDGTVTFRQEESFNGLLVGAFRKKLDTDTRQGFEQMNQHLKARVETRFLLSTA